MKRAFKRVWQKGSVSSAGGEYDLSTIVAAPPAQQRFFTQKYFAPDCIFLNHKLNLFHFFIADQVPQLEDRISVERSSVASDYFLANLDAGFVRRPSSPKSVDDDGVVLSLTQIQAKGEQVFHK
jgi:hypothetical protein